MCGVARCTGIGDIRTIKLMLDAMPLLTRIRKVEHLNGYLDSCMAVIYT